MERPENSCLLRLIKVLPLLAIALLIIFGLLVNKSVTWELWPLEEKICGQCHQMKPQVYTWKVTAHSQIACTRCHSESSLASMIFRAKTGAYQTPIRSKNFIPDQICLDCHSPERQVSPPYGLKVSHNLHLAKGVDCVDCHRDVAHAQVAAKLQGGQADYASFDLADAKKLAAYGNRIPMATCLRCHNGAKAPKECVACHGNKPLPPSHHQPTWPTDHGRQAFQDLASCNNCHEYDVAKQQETPIENGNYTLLRNYARTNEFCRDCHQQRPSGHDQYFSVTHRAQGQENPQFCFICHNQSPENLSPPPPAQVFCSKCHVDGHPANWLQTHKESARAKVAESCFSCHDTGSCTKCHARRS